MEGSEDRIIEAVDPAKPQPPIMQQSAPMNEAHHEQAGSHVA